MTAPSWDERIARARDLSAGATSVAGLLEFYARLLEWQKRVYEGVGPDENHPGERLPGLLDFVEAEGPAELQEYAARLRAGANAVWSDLLRDSDIWPSFFTAAILQPYRERNGCAEHQLGVSLLRDAGEGLRRSAVCLLCQLEQPVARIHCTSCGEQRFEALPVYGLDDSDYLRVEACDTCKKYLLNVNLVKRPEAVASVDDVAALPVHLWAQEQGYSRAHRNLFGY